MKIISYNVNDNVIFPFITLFIIIVDVDVHLVDDNFNQHHLILLLPLNDCSGDIITKG